MRRKRHPPFAPSKLRPRDPDADPIDVAGRLEKGARWLEVLEALAVESSSIPGRPPAGPDDSREAEVYDACVTTFLRRQTTRQEPG